MQCNFNAFFLRHDKLTFKEVVGSLYLNGTNRMSL